ncbi:Transglutaminase-like enzyme, putative cysteine protease [Roseomonas rosea]|uniref:Transglutaminase-like enzyme, putative cysteine protease n=1 Tax=Muricoccus roseus TaxID=198092 RepID=A0A1M6NUT0_9PROT|nr:transglutaminase family protein [Roseomonas rosea]SHJ99456.1 Transglutaminase-like enzyme, putative cysteine protease [Roseomonas rosea]
MKRRTLLSGAAGAAGLPFLPALAGAAALSLAALPPGWRRFEMRTEVVVETGDEPATLWLPLAQTAAAYQQALDPEVESTGKVERLREARYGAEVLRVTWPSPREQKVVVRQVVATRSRGVEAGGLSAAERAFWTAPTESVPTDGIVAETARRITAGVEAPEARLRAIYDWVVENTFRDGATRGCGTGDIKTMLETGWLGGKCADINALMTGLSRACGIPARDVYGIRVAPSEHSRSLGTGSPDITRAQHCRTEMFVDGRGWVPVDPADLRKIVLEEGAPLESDHVRRQRERLFGHWEMNWVGYNSATNIALPGAPRAMGPNFLMYPCAMTARGEQDCLDPASFRYAITARELAA